MAMELFSVKGDESMEVEVKREDDGNGSMEVVPVAGPSSGTTTYMSLQKVKLPIGDSKLHRMYIFVGDEKAHTTDPEEMKFNYRIPMKDLFDPPAIPSSQDLSVSANLRDAAKDEMIISPEFLDTFADGEKMKKCLDKYNYLGIYLKDRPDKHPVIKQVHEWTARLEVKPLKKDKLRCILDKSKAIKKSKDKLKRTDSSVRKSISPNTIVAGEDIFHSVMLRSLDTLKPSSEINDEIFEFGLVKTINSCDPRSEGVVYATLYGWNSYWSKDNHEMTVDKQYRTLCKQAPDKNLLKIKYLIIPVITEQHWLLVIVCNPFPSEEDVKAIQDDAKERTFPLTVYSKSLYFKWKTSTKNPPRLLVFDSLYRKLVRRGLSNYHLSNINRIRDGLYHLHKKLWMDPKNDWNFQVDPFNTGGVIKHHYVDLPGQKEDKDCGIYCMLYAKMWLSELKKARGDFLALFSMDPQKLFAPYFTYTSRSKLVKMIYSEARKKSLDHAKPVKIFYKKYFAKNED